MKVRRLASLLIVAAFAASTTLVFAAKKSGGHNNPTQKGTPLVDSFLDCNCTYGVNGDAVGGGSSMTFLGWTLYPTATYANGENDLQVYIGGSGRDENLLSYNTGRTLYITFDPSSPAYKAAYKDSNLPQSFNAEVDMYGVNNEGAYTTGMAIDDTGQMHMSLEFHVGTVTYELDWASMGAIKLDDHTWMMTTDPVDITNFGLTYSDIGFTISPAATLNVIKRHSVQAYGGVDMHMRYIIQLQQ
jgi:hypothetical protein